MPIGSTEWRPENGPLLNWITDLLFVVAPSGKMSKGLRVLSTSFCSYLASIVLATATFSSLVPALSINSVSVAYAKVFMPGIFSTLLLDTNAGMK